MASDAAARAAARAALTAAIAAAQLATPDAMAAAVQAIVAAIEAAISAPPHRMRVLADVASMPAADGPANIVILLARMAAIAAWARATTEYAPDNFDQSERAMTDFADAADALADDLSIIHADAAHDALADLRSSVMRDLAERAAQLPRITTVTRAVPLPSLVLAYQLYQNATRATELVRRANAPAPLWMPLSFRALTA